MIPYFGRPAFKPEKGSYFFSSLSRNDGYTFLIPDSRNLSFVLTKEHPLHGIIQSNWLNDPDQSSGNAENDLLVRLCYLSDT